MPTLQVEGYGTCKNYVQVTALNEVEQGLELGFLASWVNVTMTY